MLLLPLLLLIEQPSKKKQIESQDAKVAFGAPSIAVTFFALKRGEMESKFSFFFTILLRIFKT